MKYLGVENLFYPAATPRQLGGGGTRPDGARAASA